MLHILSRSVARNNYAARARSPSAVPDSRNIATQMIAPDDRERMSLRRCSTITEAIGTAAQPARREIAPTVTTDSSGVVRS